MLLILCNAVNKVLELGQSEREREREREGKGREGKGRHTLTETIYLF
jgi:hypothetical protein